MTVYYIRHDEYDDLAKVIQGLRNIYNLHTYQLTAVVVDDEYLESVVGPIFVSLAEHIEKPPLNVYNPEDGPPGYPPYASIWQVEPDMGGTITLTTTDQPVVESTPPPYPLGHP